MMSQADFSSGDDTTRGNEHGISLQSSLQNLATMKLQFANMQTEFCQELLHYSPADKNTSMTIT